jgi:DNA polymerase III epsilon subunit-like protein
MFLDKPGIVIDLETTNSALFPIEVVEVGAVKIDTTLEVEDTASWLYRPRNMENFNELCENLTGIGKEELGEQKLFSEGYKEMLDWIGWGSRAVYVWGANFDISVLREEFRLIPLTYPFNRRVVDVKSIAQFVFDLMGMKPARRSYTLAGMAERLGIEFETDVLHRALPDALLTLRVFQECAIVIEKEFTSADDARETA